MVARVGESSVAVAIPFHSNLEGLREAVASVAAWPVVVVDDSPERLLGDGGELRSFGVNAVVAGARGGGFARAANAGIAWAEAQGFELVFLLNDDAVMEPGALGRLVDAKRALPQAAAVGPVILGAEGLESAGLCFSPRTARVVQRSDVPEAPEERVALSGAAMLIDSSERFDEAFPHAMEDVELSLRLRERGGRLWVVPAARCWHAGGATLSRDSREATAAALRGHLKLVSNTPSRRPLVVLYALLQVVREGAAPRRFLGIVDALRRG